MKHLDTLLADRGLPGLGTLTGLLLADPSTARKVANQLDHLMHRHQLQAAGCTVRESTGGALDVVTAAGTSGKYSSYCTSTTGRRITVQVGRHVAAVEVAPHEVSAVLSWLPSYLDAVAANKPAPALPVPVSASLGRSRIVSAAASALSKPQPALDATSRAMQLRDAGSSYGQVARALQTEGFVPPVVGGWNPNRVRALLLAAGAPTVRALAV